MPEFVRPFERDFDLVAHLCQGSYLGVQEDTSLTKLVNLFGQRLDEVAVSTWQKTVHQFDDADLRAQLSINTAHFQTDITTPDHQQILWNVFQSQGPGAIHHPVAIDSE